MSVADLASANPTPVSLEADWDTFCAIETEIGKSEHEGVYARWRFGKMLTRYAKGGGRGGSEYAQALGKLSAELGQHESELRFRRLFAERCETEDEVVHAVNDFPSWHEIRNSYLSSTAHLSSAKDEWATPQDLFDRLDTEFHFTLDVCASHENHKCEIYYTLADDALAHEWQGTCWMNPPYSEITDWMRKAHESSQNGATVVCLVPCRTDVDWFWQFARHGEIRLLKGRLHFVDDEGNTGPAPFPSCLVVFNRNPAVTWYEH